MTSSPLRHLRSLGLFSLLFALGACTPEKPAVGPDTVPTTSAVTPAKPDAPKGPDPYLATGPFLEETFPIVETAPLAAGALALPYAPKGVAAPPPVCAEYLKNKATEVPACADVKAALDALDKALDVAPPTSFDTPAAAEAAAKSRDAKLAALESCAAIPSGLVRALRIDLAPAACGDVLADPILKAPPKDLRADVHEALFGLALAARFARAGGAAPTLAAPYTIDRVQKFTTGPLLKWTKETATVIQDISADASKLHYYGGAVAAVAAGVADLALVDTVRGAPLPDEYQKDEERKNIYYASLDIQLEPRKTRGRDAALVGLKKFAEVGSISDSRVQEARRLLSKLYGGRRIDALDRLLLPPSPGASPATVEERLAARLPTFYAGILLDSKTATLPSVLAVLAARGVPLAHRKALHEAPLTAERAELEAWAHLGLGRIYWRATDFDEAARALTASTSRTPQNKLLAALAIALRAGPKDAIDMMLKSPLGMNAHGQRAALDALAAEATPFSGAAAFDAAYLMEITAPEKADALFFKSLAKRYAAAADLLTDPTQKSEAQERAKAAEAISGHVQ